ncbi:MAG: sensor histidine kinase [Candidatus Thorarchaeota archaeon]
MTSRNSRLHRLYNILLGPNSKAKNERESQQSALLYAFQLAMIPFSVLTIITGDLVINIEFLIPVAIALILVTFMITRFVSYKSSVRLVVSLYTILPIFIWFSVTTWQPYDIPRIMPYIIVALTLGALFINKKIVLVQGLVTSIIIIYTLGIVHAFSFTEYDNYLLTVGILTFMVIIFSRLTDSYLDQIEKQSDELKRQNKELDIYTKLLRHDLSNDLQAVINSVELSQMLLPLSEEKVNENLEESLNFSMRMKKLLQVFKLPLEQPRRNLVEVIRNIAAESEETHSNLRIEVTWTPEAERETITVGRLLPLVWTNIFRNASQHAGEHPTVSVDISIVDHNYQVIITDDGPGIPQEQKERLFRKDASLENRDRGIGLYLSKLIIESHNGTIEISNIPQTQFIIRIPVRLKS